MPRSVKIVMPDLSIVILCYRSEKHIIPLVAQIIEMLNNSGIDFELVMVANYDAHGPIDKTPQIVKEIAAQNQRCVFVAETKKGRMGWDLRRGLAKTRGKYIAFLDGDGQTQISDILHLYALAQKENADIYKIYRASRGDSNFRKILSKVYNLVFRIVFPNVRLRDINAKPKLMTRYVYERMRLTSDDWFIDAEISLEIKRLNLKAVEIPGVGLRNEWRKSFISFFTVLEFLKNIILYRFRYWFL